MIVQEFNLNMIPDSEPVVVHVNQYDTGDGRFVIHLYDGDTPYTPTNATVLIEGCKPDGNVFAYGPSNGVSISGNTVTAPCLIQMTAVKGRTMTNLIVKENGASTGTFVFWLDVQETPLDRAILSETEIPAIIALAEEQAERSEAWAVGTKNGHLVPDTDPTFDNNAKYWAEQAASSVTGVASFNGRSGSVLPMAGDYTAEQITYNETSNVAIELGNLSGAIEAKASKTDLTSIVVTGSTNTTGSTITANKYFYLNGTLVRAKVDIANGASFTLNTNYEVVTAGALNVVTAALPGQVIAEYTVPNDTMTWGQALDNLAAQIGDLSKIPMTASIVLYDSLVLQVYAYFSGELIFGSGVLVSTTGQLTGLDLKSSGSTWKAMQFNNGSSSIVDRSSNAAGNGNTIKIVN